MVSTPDSRRKQSGIALVLITGLLTLFAFLGLATIGTARFSAAAARAVLSGRSAMCAAESGLEYAAARLWEDPSTPADTGQAASATNRCDDWTQRTHGPHNPSYGRGDGWKDDGDGAYIPGTQDSAIPRSPMDLDRDGKFDAWSGRLRGNEGAFSNTFSLRIVCAQALVCLNSGELGLPSGDQDMDGLPNGSDPDYLPDSDANGLPDHCDPAFHGNLHLVNLLNNLGAVLKLSDVHPEPYAPPPASPQAEAALLGTVAVSDLGKKVVTNRPPGGYRSVEDLRAFLPAADYDAVALFLGTVGETAPISAGPSFSAPEGAFIRMSRLDFNHVSVEILEAALRYISAGDPFVRLLPDEAHDVALHLDAERKKSPVFSWKQFLKALHAGGAGLYEPDPFITAYNAAYPSQQGVPFDPLQPLLKEDLILAQFDASWCGADLFHARRDSLEVDRDPDAQSPPDLAKPRVILQRNIITTSFGTAPYVFPSSSSGGSSSGGGSSGGGSSGGSWSGGGSQSGGTGQGSGQPAPITGIPSRQTVPFSLIPRRDAFQVQTLDGRARGDLSIGGESLLLTSQQDFTPLLASGFAGDPNPAAWRYAEGKAFCDASGSPATRSGIQCGPRFSLVRPDGTGPNHAIATFEKGPLTSPQTNYHQYRHPKAQGWLELAARQWPESADGTLSWLNRGDITFALPNNEDDPASPLYEGTQPPKAWMDNVFDPVNPRPAAPTSTVHLSTGLSGSGMMSMSKSPLSTHFQDGIRFSPWGFRAHKPQTEAFVVDWAEPPFTNSPYQGGHRWVDQGAVAFWYQAESDQKAAMLFQFRTVGTLGTGMTWVDYLTLEVNGVVNTVPTSDTVVLTYKDDTYQTTAAAVSSFPYPSGQTPLASTGWRCVVLNLSSQGPYVAIDLFVDGKLMTSSPLKMYFPGALADSGMRAYFDPAGLDDVTFYNRPLSVPEIQDLALTPRHAPTGTYSSPRIRFDQALYPKGVTLRDLSWDGFIPQTTGVACDFTVNGYDAAGAKVGGASFSWDSASGSLPGGPIDLGSAVHSFDFQVTITAKPALMVPDGSGAPTPVLRDSPTIEEIRFSYGDARPSWSGIR